MDKNNVITDMQSKIECRDRNMKEKVDLLETTFKVMSVRVQMIEAKLVRETIPLKTSDMGKRHKLLQT